MRKKHKQQKKNGSRPVSNDNKFSSDGRASPSLATAPMKRQANFGSILIQLGLTWLVVALLARVANQFVLKKDGNDSVHASRNDSANSDRDEWNNNPEQNEEKQESEHELTGNHNNEDKEDKTQHDLQKIEGYQKNTRKEEERQDGGHDKEKQQEKLTNNDQHDDGCDESQGEQVGSQNEGKTQAHGDERQKVQEKGETQDEDEQVKEDGHNRQSQEGPPTESAPQNTTRNDGKRSVGEFRIPKELTGPLSSYPNPLFITDEARRMFSPVVKFPFLWVDDKDIDDNNNRDDETSSSQIKMKNFPLVYVNYAYSGKKRKVPNYQVKEFSNGNDETRLIHPDDQTEFRNNRNDTPQKETEYEVSRYDENRVEASLFGAHEDDLSHDDEENNNNTTNHDEEGYFGNRTLHVGMDIRGPVGTKVYAFYHGTIHSSGYNDKWGDYGNVIVVEHSLPTTRRNKDDNKDDNNNKEAGFPDKVWALYGHLDAKSIKAKKVGDKIKKGQVLGRMGDVHENGGWGSPHVHFQLSTKPPVTHDMPKAVAMKDRSRALVEFPDPRLVLGPLY